MISRSSSSSIRNFFAKSRSFLSGNSEFTTSILAVGHLTTPFISVYPWVSRFGTKYADPATLPTGNGLSVAFSPSGNDIAVAHPTTPFISVYPWSSGFGTKYTDPATLPAEGSRGVAWK